MNRRKSSNQEYSQFREYLEALSEKSRIPRNHFYNHAFNNETLLKIVEVQKIADEMHKLAAVCNRDRVS